MAVLNRVCPSVLVQHLTVMHLTVTRPLLLELKPLRGDMTRVWQMSGTLFFLSLLKTSARIP